MNDFKVVGKNTKLLFTGFISPFSAVGCKNVSFKGFSVDYTRTFHSEAEILAVGDGYMDLRFRKTISIILLTVAFILQTINVIITFFLVY